MSVLHEQAIQMVGGLSEDNVRFLIDFIQRFMPPVISPDKAESKMGNARDEESFMQEMEEMRLKAKDYFPTDFDPGKVWEEAVKSKYGSFD